MRLHLLLNIWFFLEESVSADVKKLLHQSFESAINNLKSACDSETPEECKEYLKRARDKFNDAIPVEENENKVASYLGLAVCQYLLGGVANSKITMEKIKDVELSEREGRKYRTLDFGKSILGNLNPLRRFPRILVHIPIYYTTAAYDGRVNKLERYKLIALRTEFDR